MDKLFLAVIYASILLLVTAFAMTTPKEPQGDRLDRPALMQRGG